MSRKIVYILGLSRVGSTLMDLVLGSNPRFIGLGEVYAALGFDWQEKAIYRQTCSCGQKTKDCPFWGAAADRLSKKGKAGMREKYLTLLDSFNEIYGSDKIMVDSSKWLHALKDISTMQDVELKTIYLIRDVRAWTISRLDKRRTRPQTFNYGGVYSRQIEKHFGGWIKLFRPLIPFITRLPSYYFWVWYLQNRQIGNYLDQNNIPFLQVSYDELGLHPQVNMERIFDYLDISQHYDEDASFTGSQSHILIGNERKSDTKRRQGIFYDNRWFYRNEWIKSAALFPHIMKYNAEHVYPQSGQSIWKR